MPMTKRNIATVRRIAAEVIELADLVEIEQLKEKRYDSQQGRYVLRYPDGEVPKGANIQGGRATAALRRRSLDLTMALADLRRSTSR